MGVEENMQLKKPSKLKAGDKVATISLSWGGAGDDLITVL
jgi:hypothetical protein